MNLIALGINHNSASVEVRERVAFAPEQVGDALGDLLGEVGRHVRRREEQVLRERPVPPGLACKVAGLLLKAAVFPLHFWLPPAHANATPPVSAALSGLAVKAPLYLVLRLWLSLYDGAWPLVAELLAALGAAGVQEAIYSLLMMKEGFIAPSINIDEMDPVYANRAFDPSLCYSIDSCRC